jgi:hypothetical protein
MEERKKKQQVRIKQPTSAFAGQIKYFLPLIEELIKEEMLPFAIIGISKLPNDDGKTYKIHVATHNDTQDKMFYDMCQSYVAAVDNGTAIKK